MKRESSVIRAIHIRKRPDAPSSEPCYCGEAGTSITEAWGYYGPAGAGWVRVCKPCVVAAPNTDPGTRKLAQSELEAKKSC